MSAVIVGFESKGEYYLADFERTFCTAPTTTASMSGVVPSAAISGRSASLKRMRPKKMPGGMEWRALDMPEVVEVVKSVVLVAGVRTAGERYHRRRDERGDAPAEELEDPLRDQHHREGDRARRRREGAHELGVVVRVGEGHLEARLPRDLDDVDRHPVADHESSEEADVPVGRAVSRSVSGGRSGSNS